MNGTKNRKLCLWVYSDCLPSPISGYNGVVLSYTLYGTENMLITGLLERISGFQEIGMRMFTQNEQSVRKKRDIDLNPVFIEDFESFNRL